MSNRYSSNPRLLEQSINEFMTCCQIIHHRSIPGNFDTLQADAMVATRSADEAFILLRDKILPLIPDELEDAVPVASSMGLLEQFTTTIRQRLENYPSRPLDTESNQITLLSWGDAGLVLKTLRHIVTEIASKYGERFVEIGRRAFAQDCLDSRTDSPGAISSEAPDDPVDSRKAITESLTESEELILSHMDDSKLLGGKQIATKSGYSDGYVRQILPKLVAKKLVVTGPNGRGYRKVGI